MKVRFFNISVSLFALVIGLASCENTVNEKESLLSNVKQLKGGEDTDEPIIVGLAIDQEENPVYPGVVKLFQDENPSEIAVQSLGENGSFRFDSLSTGNYLLKLYQNNQLLVKTESFEVSDSTYVVIQVQE